jgi:hypothetical protein
MTTQDYIKIIQEKDYWSKKLNYQFISTFWEEFSISDKYGPNGVREHFEEVFGFWKKDCKLLTELVLVLNLKTWSWFQVDDKLGVTYDDLWKKADAYALKHLKGEDLAYYLASLD